MDAIFTAVDTAGVATKVSATIVAFIGIRLLFMAYKFSNKLMNRA